MEEVYQECNTEMKRFASWVETMKIEKLKHFADDYEDQESRNNGRTKRDEAEIMLNN